MFVTRFLLLTGDGSWDVKKINNAHTVSVAVATFWSCSSSSIFSLFGVAHQVFIIHVLRSSKGLCEVKKIPKKLGLESHH